MVMKFSCHRPGYQNHNPDFQIDNERVIRSWRSLTLPALRLRASFSPGLAHNGRSAALFPEKTRAGGWWRSAADQGAK